MWHASVSPGDWVKATDIIPVTASDHLFGNGIPAGTRGVVTGRSGGRVDVDFDIHGGIARARIPASKCAVIRRRGGKESFMRRAGLVGTVRVALGIFMFWPLIQFIAQYWWQYRTFDGIVEEAVLAFLDSLGDLLLSGLADPVRAVLYLIFITVLSRIAFRH